MTHRSDIIRAVIWMSGAVVSFLTMSLAGRSLGAQFDTFEIMTWRSLTGLAIMICVLTLRRSWQQVTFDRMGLHLARNLAHFTGQNLWFYAVTLIPLAQLFALEFSSPIWVLILSAIILGERLTRPRILAALIGFCGILVVTRPGAESLSPGLIAAAACAVFFALTTVFTKRLTRDISTLSIIFWMTVTQSVFGLVTALFDGEMALPTLDTLPLLVLVGCAGLFAHFCVTSALALAPATVVVPIDFTRLPLAALLGALFLGEPLDMWVLIGAALIFLGNYLNIRWETRARQAVDSV